MNTEDYEKSPSPDGHVMRRGERSYCSRSLILARPALAQASSLSPPGAPLTPMAAIVSLPTLIGRPPTAVASWVSKTAGLNPPPATLFAKSAVETLNWAAVYALRRG